MTLLLRDLSLCHQFLTELIRCLMPHIYSKYSVVEGREGANIGGFSMGGRETLYTLMQYPDHFKYVCAMAPAPGMTPAKDNFMTHPGSLQEDEFRFRIQSVRERMDYLLRNARQRSRQVP